MRIITSLIIVTASAITLLHQRVNVYLLEVYQRSCMVLTPGLMTAILCASGVTVSKWLVGFYEFVSMCLCSSSCTWQI